jgi:hypothetical protein
MTSTHFFPVATHYLDQAFYNTTAEEKRGDVADPLYIGAMTSVEAICEAIEKDLNLES